jgi:hypothetical protein
MYQVDALDLVVALDGIPAPDMGAPMPLVLANDHAVVLAYYGREPDSQKQPPTIVIHFVEVWAQYLGAPNDEAFEGHPLAARGLRAYAAWEVQHSSWIRQLETINRVHRSHDPERFAEYRHFIFAFHDRTFECVAREIEVLDVPVYRDLLAFMSQAL